MTAFTIANLGDAALNITTGTLITSGTINSVGITFIKNSSGGPITVTVQRGLSLVAIKDALGNANTYPITIVASDASNIDATASYVIAVPYGWVWLSDNGSHYSIIG